MENFEKINFDTFLDYFEDANARGTRIRASEHERWNNFLTHNNISPQIVREAIMTERSGSKVCIIEEGNNKGLYLYSWNTDFPQGNYSYKYNISPKHKPKDSENIFTEDEQKAILFALQHVQAADGKVTKEEDSYYFKIVFSLFNRNLKSHYASFTLGLDKAIQILSNMPTEKKERLEKMMKEMANVDGDYSEEEKTIIDMLTSWMNKSC